MNSTETMKLLLAASGGDTVKLFDIWAESRDLCVLSYTPSPSFRVNSLKWNHNNLVVASAGDDKKVSLWRKNGHTLWTVPAKTDSGENIEESISTISFSNKGSRYICSGGSDQIVRIWDLQKKRCVKWLRGHTDTIAGAMYNCKDEHIASISHKGDLIIHNLASSTKATELKDPNGQVLGALDYSRMSRHLLVTAGDDGSIHLWDTTSRSPKVSWLKQHFAPTSSISFSPLNDKIIASVGLDKKLYTFDTASKKVSSCITYEAPFSSLAFKDDGLMLVAGTTTGQIVFYDVRGKPQPINVLRAYGNYETVSSLCWQTSKPVSVNESSCTDETVLLAGDVRDSSLMPDPLPSMTSSSLPTSSSMFGSQNPSHSISSVDLYSSPAGGTLARLHAPRSYNFKDDMEVFSPLVEVQPVTPSLDKFWGARGSSKKDLSRKPSFLNPSRRFDLSDEGANDSHPIFDWKSNSTSKQDDMQSTLSQSTSTPASTSIDDSSITPPEYWGGQRFSDNVINLRPAMKAPSRFSISTSNSLSSGSMTSGLQDMRLPASRNTGTTSSLGLNLAKLCTRETSNQETTLGSSEHNNSPSLSTKGILGQANVDYPTPTFFPSRRFSSYAERIGAMPPFSDAVVGSPKCKKTGVETREELLNSLLSRSSMLSATETGVVPDTNQEEVPKMQETPLQPDLQPGTSFSLHLFRHTLEETLASFQKSNHEDIRNLHIEILRQFHMQEMEISSVMRLILENQAEIMKEIQSLRKETKQLRQLL